MAERLPRIEPGSEPKIFFTQSRELTSSPRHALGKTSPERSTQQTGDLSDCGEERTESDGRPLCPHQHLPEAWMWVCEELEMGAKRTVQKLSDLENV